MEHISDSQVIDEINGQGLGDPDIHGHYPGDGGEKDCIYCSPKSVKHKTPSVYAQKHWSETSKKLNLYEPYEFADNDPASPEEAEW